MEEGNRVANPHSRNRKQFPSRLTSKGDITDSNIATSRNVVYATPSMNRVSRCPSRLTSKGDITDPNITTGRNVVFATPFMNRVSRWLPAFFSTPLFLSKPKSCTKERVRLKLSSTTTHTPLPLSCCRYFRTRSFLLLLLFLLGICFSSSLAEETSPNWCPAQCSCETFFLPTVSGVQNAWPSLLTSSLLSETLLVPLRNPTSFDALVASILTTHEDEGKRGMYQEDFPSLAPRTGSTFISPGEVFVDCSNGAFQNYSFVHSGETEETLQKVVKLDLSWNDLTSLQKSDFLSLTSLRYLILDMNLLDSVSADDVPSSLLHLSLEGNKFTSFPLALETLSQLKILNLARNQLTALKEHHLPMLSNLVLLSLHGNEINRMDEGSLDRFPRLQILDLTNNHLPNIPEAITKCQNLRQILLGDNKITHVIDSNFFGLTKLQWVDLQGNPLLNVQPQSFVHLPSLVKLILESVRNLDQFPSFNGTTNLKVLRIDRGALKSVPEGLCTTLPQIKSLNLHLNQIESLPTLDDCHTLRLLDLSNNKIQSLEHRRFEGVPHLHDLLLQFNYIEFIPNDAFHGLKGLQVLNLEYNRIAVIEPAAFLPLVNLEDINLGNNHFSQLPSVGLERVVNLKAHNNRYLRVFPGPESFPSVHSLVLSYAYHCCPFLSSSLGDGTETSTEFQEDVVFSVDQLHKFDPDIWNNSNVWPHIEGIPTSEFINVWSSKGEDSSHNEISTPYEDSASVTPPSMMDVILGKMENRNGSVTTGNGTGAYRRRSTHNIYCIPQPGPFMPCRDLFDWWTLRCGVWLVFLLALMGNGVVVIVLVSAYSKMDVPRFLVANLALADFFMGIYLGILAVVDASTLGDFRMYAIPWQMSVGCQLAGFLGVLSSELSVYTLTVITMERNYAITHAMHLNKRLSLKHAAYIMTIGWVFALTMAILPLAGISDYRKFAVCLPFETDGSGLGYIVFLMFINGIAFLILMGCYLKIYCAIRGSQAWNSNDSRIAKRMALLVFTDFICWAPIAFFSLSAAFGLQFLSLEGAKVFTVFVLPFNSCCNPFLYALLTKQFKKDCVMLCKAIEESRVTRGIGRCRHSSNFSNRQTPANTNSALDPNSKEEHQTCSCRHNDQQAIKNSVAIRTLRYLCCHDGETDHSAPGKTSTHTNRSPSKEVRMSNTEISKTATPWSWRGQTAANLRLLELRRQATMDLARKSSQESSLSSSRNDSSGTSGSTMTWRISRSSVSSDASSSGTKGARNSSLKDKTKNEAELTCKPEPGFVGRGIQTHGKPRLQRQRAIDKDPGTIQISHGNELRCPLHARGDNLSCVYEQASLEEEDSNEVFLVSETPFHSHKRSLSDGLLCGTLLSLSAPTPQLISSIAPSLHKSTSPAKDPVVNVYSESSEIKTESYDDVDNHATTSGKPGVLETHFPVMDRNQEGDPLLHKRN